MNKQLHSKFRAELLMRFREVFPKLSSKFPISNLNIVFLQQIKSFNFLHVFFAMEDDVIRPVFFFNNLEECVRIDDTGKVFHWVNEHLVLVSKKQTASIEAQIEMFDVLAQKLNNNLLVSQCIRLDLKAIVSTFKSLNGVEISIGVSDTLKSHNQFVVIFEVPIAQCKYLDNSIIDKNRIAYFDFGK